jgi:hypothetical protein
LSYSSRRLSPLKPNDPEIGIRAPFVRDPKHPSIPASLKLAYRYLGAVVRGLEEGRLQDVSIGNNLASLLKPDRASVSADLQPLTFAQAQYVKDVYAILQSLVLARTLRAGIKVN